MKIEAKGGRGDKIHIIIDGEYTCTVDSDFWYSSSWRSVKEIDDGDDEKKEEFLSFVFERHTYLAALRLLSYGDHSKKDLIKRLCQKGHKRPFAESAAEKLEHYGYIDDERYARHLSEKLMREKHLSKRGIASELYGKGIDRSIIDEVISEIEVDPREEIKAVIEKKYSGCLGDEKGRRRAINGLLRLGYSYGDINSVLGEQNE